MSKLRRITWAGNVARIGRAELHTGFWWGKPQRRDHLEDPGVDDMVTSKFIFKKWDGGLDWIDVALDRDIWASCCDFCNEPSAFIKCGEFLDYFITC